jgi:lipopolysaccharide transport system ATP-binding protein
VVKVTADPGETFLDRLVDAAMFRVMPDAQRLETGTVDFLVEACVKAAAEAEAST